MPDILEIVQSILAGVPWTDETARAAGFPSLHAARTRTLGAAHFIDDEAIWPRLESDFELAVSQVSGVWGTPIFHGAGDNGYRCFRGTERLAYWQRDEQILFVQLFLGDNERIRLLRVGELRRQELSKP